jgi:transposase
MFYYWRDRAGEHTQAHLADYTGIFRADAFRGCNKLYEADRKPGPLVEAACWVHARRPFFVMADVTANTRRKAQGKTTSVISPPALEAVLQIVRSELLEISLCSVGSLPSALVTERSHRVTGDRSTIAGRKLLAWQRRASLPLAQKGGH